MKKKSMKIDNVIPYIRRRMSPTTLGIAILAIVVLIICMINVYSDNAAYTGYEIISSVTRNDGDSANYLEYQDGYIRYSNDGIAYYKSSGDVVWNHVYEINNAQVKINGEYIVVGNITGRNLYVYNKSGLKCEIDAAMSVTQVDIAKQGVSVVSLEDGDTNYINMYDSNGNKLSYIITSLTGDGYPLDMAISEDGNKLAVSYVSINGEKIQSHMAFYNFSDVGQNSVDRLVGGFDHYEDSVVGKVEFVNNDTVVAIAEDRISIYSISQYPSLKEEIMLEKEIQKITYSSDYIGLIFNNTDSVDKYQIDIYDIKGQKISSISYNENYRNYEFNDKHILMYNEKNFTLYSIKGKKKYEDSFDMTIEKILSLSEENRFMVFNSKYIQEIILN